MLKNCVFKDSVNTRKWMVNAGIRAVKTMAQTAVAVMGTSTVLSAIDWRMVLSSAIVAAIVSILTSVAGLPEAPCEGE
ncbi:MAG: holin [Coprococcus catus]|uniref:holin n=1 Tax=Coprococcus catus TaxID=116085 RepID=UPI001D090F73|nr:holin [Coprococcus catus]MCB6493058.1 holin [Coprococcus catus]MEE0817412.1 holin [Coprococcus catus]